MEILEAAQMTINFHTETKRQIRDYYSNEEIPPLSWECLNDSVRSIIYHSSTKIKQKLVTVNLKMDSSRVL